MKKNVITFWKFSAVYWCYHHCHHDFHRLLNLSIIFPDYFLFLLVPIINYARIIIYNTIWKALVSRASPQAKTIPRLATGLTHLVKKSSWSTSCVVLSSSGTMRNTRKVRAHPCRSRPAEKGDLHFGVYHTERVDWGRESVLRGQDQITSGETQEQRVGEGGG